MKPGGGRAKGRAFEQDIVNRAKAHGFAGAQRTAPIQAGGEKTHPDVANVGVLWIEAKAYRANVPQAMFREALDTERPGYVNAVVWKTNRVEPRVTLLFEDLLKLMAALREQGPRTNDGIVQALPGAELVLLQRLEEEV